MLRACLKVKLEIQEMIGRHNKIEYSRARTRTVGFDSATHGVEPGSSPFQLKELVLQAMRKKEEVGASSPSTKEDGKAQV